MATAQWSTPFPLWREPALRESVEAFRQPTLLRFATDGFMDEVGSVLRERPDQLASYVAQPESWRTPRAGLHASPAPAALPLKLYQPAHQRFYLVAASLVCRVPGFPDHTIDTGADESVSFVLRRVTVAEGGDVARADQRTEFAWIPGEPGAWSAVTSPYPIQGEELLPMFPMSTREEKGTRRMYGGFISVAKREVFATGRVPGPAPAAVTDDPRLIDLQRRVVDPWADLVDWYGRRLSPADRSTPSTIQAVAQASSLVLLDFANYLAETLPGFWNAIDANTEPAAGPARDLFTLLGTPGAPTSLRSALLSAKREERALEALVLPTTGAAPSVPSALAGLALTTPEYAAILNRSANQSRPIVAAVRAALPTPAPSPLVGGPIRQPAVSNLPEWYVIRCVYRRPRCTPLFGPTVSEATVPFQLASYFDVDAPSRPLAVVLPIDTTPAGLRKADKGVAFVISDELNKQMNRVKGIKQLMDGELEGPGIGLGMICSLSIPIITICAFIVLMIFIQLLNIVFWWLPFFKICFPIPTLKAKG